MPEPKRIVFDLGGKVRISPPMWTDNHLDVEPGDLSKFAPTGCGLYGYQLRDGATNPFTGAPSQESSGGGRLLRQRHLATRLQRSPAGPGSAQGLSEAPEGLRRLHTNV